MHDVGALRVVRCMNWRTVVLSGAAGFLLGQTGGGPRFEVASIKVNRSTELQAPQTHGVGTDRFTATYVSVKWMIGMAYEMYDYQISGGPAWMDAEHFDIAAKAPGQADRREMERMVQSLLADRFQLRFHRETRDRSVMSLVVGKQGHKLGPPATDGSRNNASERRVTGQNAGVDFLARMLTFQLGETVVDKTGLDGMYSFDLHWGGDLSLYAAVEEQLGLKLQGSKGPVEYLVVEYVESPTEN